MLPDAVSPPLGSIDIFLSCALFMEDTLYHAFYGHKRYTGILCIRPFCMALQRIPVRSCPSSASQLVR